MYRDHYDVLEIDPAATASAVAAAYRYAVWDCHPDLHPGDEEAAAKFREIQEVYEMLSDPKKRDAYDAGEFVPPKQYCPVENTMNTKEAGDNTLEVIAAMRARTLSRSGKKLRGPSNLKIGIVAFVSFWSLCLGIFCAADFLTVVFDSRNYDPDYQVSRMSDQERQERIEKVRSRSSAHRQTEIEKVAAKPSSNPADAKSLQERAVRWGVGVMLVVSVAVAGAVVWMKKTWTAQEKEM